jgi:lipid-binding SYLF domain-containing protein
MRYVCRHVSGVAILLSVLLIGACATDTRESTNQQLSRAEATFTRFQSDPEMNWFRNNVGRARAVLISPSITRAGFVVGGSGGDALLLARDDGGRWAGPAFYNMGTASVGFQAGVDQSEVVILVMNEKALDALLSRSVKLGGDASVAAGPVGVGASGTVNADMITFSRSKGLFAGVSLEGAVISPDTNANSAFYSSSATPSDILVRHTVSNPTATPLQQALSRSTTAVGRSQ